MPAPDEDFLLHESLFAKQSYAYDEEKYDDDSIVILTFSTYIFAIFGEVMRSCKYAIQQIYVVVIKVHCNSKYSM